MRFLHTSDWHVGKKIRGHSRHDEHVSVLGEIVQIAQSSAVDVVLVAGDLFETSSPTADAEALVYRTLLALAEDGRHVAVIAGNHDNARRLAAVSPLLELGNVHLATEPLGPDGGGVRELDVNGEHLRLAMLPFVSQRGIIRATELMDGAAFEHANVYADRMRAMLGLLARDFDEHSVNIVMSHAFVHGGAIGGGERLAHLIEEYAITAQSFPATASYVALGHLHRSQKISGPGAIHYSGSPLQLDFGESGEPNHVNIIEVAPGTPAAVSKVQLKAGRPLVTMTGTLDDLRAQAGELASEQQEPWIRVRVDEPRRNDLAEDVRNLLGDGVVDVQLVGSTGPASPRRAREAGRDPLTLFTEYLDELGIDDGDVRNLFVELLEDELEGSS